MVATPSNMATAAKAKVNDARTGNTGTTKVNSPVTTDAAIILEHGSSFFWLPALNTDLKVAV